jgi:biotin carboxylase
MILLTGLSLDLLGRLGRLAPSCGIAVLEDPAVLRRRGIDPATVSFPGLEHLVLAPYHHSTGYREALEDLPLTAVVPVTEYTVRAAADIAASRRLPGAGHEAAQALTDKVILREAADKAGIAQPRWSIVEGPGDVGPGVLKPADRAGSLGVQILDENTDADEAWRLLFAQDADDPMLAPTGTRGRVLLEERLVGPEFSVEALVRDGQLIWSNPTAKHVWPGRYPVEAGHDVPAAAGRLVRATEDLVAALGFGTGILHAEWIVRDGVPHLVECAGRPPGDGILDLLDSAYGCDTVDLYVRLMSGAPITPPVATSGAAARFLTAPPGRVESVTGIETARATEGVTHVEVYPEPGGQVAEVRSSWGRLGEVIATGSTVEHAAAAADRAVAAITIRTTPTPPIGAEPARAEPASAEPDCPGSGPQTGHPMPPFPRQFAEADAETSPDAAD